MLRSTHTPSTAAPGALLSGWTEHKAPTGHTYYYNADTKESTYTRPVEKTAPEPAPVAPPNPYASAPSLSDPRAANAYVAQFQPHQHPATRDGARRGGFEGRPKPQPTDKPRRRETIPGCEPWVLVYTKYSRRFVYNPDKNASYWRIPEKLVPGILELDKARIRAKAGEQEDDKEQGEAKIEAEKKPGPKGRKEVPVQSYGDPGDSSEYEEVEVTDDEGNEDDEHQSKRQRTEQAEEEGPIEFTEADMVAQLQAMGADYDLEPGEYDDGNEEDWPEGAGGVEFGEDDAKLLFKDLLDDFRINPYSPWEKLIDEGKIIDDPRYTALNTTKARKDCWDEWTRERINTLKQERARQEKKDPRIAYMALLQDKATPKLYWPEFKRKYKKEPAMKDLALSDKDKEKLYREYITRLKLPQATLKADLMNLLRAQPLHHLNGASLSRGLPTPVLIDPRYASLEPAMRDPMVEAYVQSLPQPADGDPTGEEGERREKERDARERREKALEERNRVVEEQKRQRERDVAISKARLREGERELEVAMRVDKRGLQSQFADDRT